MSGNSPKYYIVTLMFVFCTLFAAQVFYIYRSLEAPKTIAALIFRNDIPPECDVVEYDLMISQMSNYINSKGTATSQKVITLIDFSPKKITVFVPSDGTPEDAQSQKIRSLLIEHVRKATDHQKTCYSKQKAGQDNPAIMPLIRVELIENRMGIKILDWIAMTFNLAMLLYLAVLLRRKMA